MGRFTGLSDSDLQRALTQDAEAIERSHALLRNLNQRENLGLAALAESTVKLLEHLGPVSA